MIRLKQPAGTSFFNERPDSIQQIPADYETKKAFRIDARKSCDESTWCSRAARKGRRAMDRQDKTAGQIPVDKKEIFRYLGYRHSAPDAEVDRIIDTCLLQLQQVVTPRFMFREYPVESIWRVDGVENSREPQTPRLRIAGMEIFSRSLSRNLRGCESVYLMAATLGLGPDRLIARASVTHMSRAVILQAAAAAMIESWCDIVNRQIAERAAAEGLYCRPRFSPGYGDFPLEYQRDFAQILHLQKEIGVSLTESLLMMPSKSVTAIIGLSREREGCVLHGCEECAKAADCAYSRT